MRQSPRAERGNDDCKAGYQEERGRGAREYSQNMMQQKKKKRDLSKFYQNLRPKIIRTDVVLQIRTIEE